EVESGAELEQRRHPPAHLDAAFIGLAEAGNKAQKRGLPRPVAADDAEILSFLQAKGNIVERVKRIAALPRKHLLDVHAEQLGFARAGEGFCDVIYFDQRHAYK